jgi:hypothetical protein
MIGLVKVAIGEFGSRNLDDSLELAVRYQVVEHLDLDILWVKP